MTDVSPSKKPFNPTPFAQDIVSRAGIVDETTEAELIRAMSLIDRSKFIVSGYEDRLTEDVSLPIGFKQMSLKPSALARSIGLLGIHKGMRVLEVGAGSGYGSALMLSMGAEVFCMEQAGLFAQQTRKKLDAMGFSKILFRAGDGSRGWAELAPFDAIIVTFPSLKPTKELLSQLRSEKGKLVGPFGNPGEEHLWLYESGKILHSYELEPWSG